MNIGKRRRHGPFQAAIMVALILTTAYALAVHARPPANCCGVDIGGGSCNLESPYRGCNGDANCKNQDFPKCCETGQYCSID